MLPAGFIIVAIILRLASGASYMRATWQGRARPSLVSWGFWSLTAFIAFGVQIAKGAGPQALVTLAIGLSPLAVCIAAVLRGIHKTKLGLADKWCIALTVAGIALWLLSKNPLTAMAFSITADVFSNVPTLLKGYRKPHTEHPAAYCITVLAMAITLLTIKDWRLTNWLFPAYILAINVLLALTVLVFSRIRSWRLLQPSVAVRPDAAE